MTAYIYGEKNGIDLIDLIQTLRIENSKKFTSGVHAGDDDLPATSPRREM
jgi:hypothetical protein